MTDHEHRTEARIQRLEREAAEHRERANEAARLSADARDRIVNLERVIADKDDEIRDLQRQRFERDVWADRLAAAHHPGYRDREVFLGEPYEAIENVLGRIVRTRETDRA